MQACPSTHGWNHDDVEIAVVGQSLRSAWRARARWAHSRRARTPPWHRSGRSRRRAPTRSSPPRGLHPPKLRTDVKTQTSKLADGNFLLDNFPNLTVPGPHDGGGRPAHLDAKLQPVWVFPIGTDVTSTNLRQQTYNGKPVLTWWKGVVTNTGASTSGEVDIVDQHYRNVAAIKAAAPWIISVHDAVISGGNIWVTVYRNVPGQDLSALGGSASGVVYDSGVQEYNIKTGKLLYTWDALNPGGTPNIPLSESEQPAPPAAAPAGTPWDAYHINSIQLLPGNQMLVSMRNTWAAYLINTKTNQTIWTLGGKASSFNIAANAAFAWQHDVQMLPHNQVSLFNDNCCAITGPGVFAAPNGASGGLILTLNTGEPHGVPRLLLHPQEPSPGPGVPRQHERAAQRQCARRLGLPALLLRVLQDRPAAARRRLAGQGPQLPRAVLRQLGGHPVLPAERCRPQGQGQGDRVRQLGRRHCRSPHGRSWPAPTRTTFPVVATKTKTGFETAIALAKSAKVYKVQAFDAKGHLLRTSKAFSVPKPKSLPLPPPGSY